MQENRLRPMQLHIDLAIEQIEKSINEKYSDKTIEKFNTAISQLEIVAIMVHRIDKLLSDDDGEDDFSERWNEEMQNRLANPCDKSCYSCYRLYDTTNRCYGGYARFCIQYIPLSNP